MNDGRRGENKRVPAPPRLQLHLLRKVKFLLMINVIPLALGAWLLYGWMQGEIAFRADTGEIGTVLFVVLIGCLGIGFAAWVVLPVGRWLRDYPRWQHRHGEAPMLWLLPRALGWLSWALLWLLVVGSIIGVLFVMATGLWELITG